MTKRTVACFILLASLAFVLAPHASYALDELSTPEVPAYTLPETCSVLLAETPSTGEPAATWSPIALITAPKSDPSTLNWSWQAPTSSDPEATFSGYGFALYNGETLVTNGELGADAQQYSYSVTSDGVYRLFVWVLDDTEDPATPVATGCEYADNIQDTTPPAINGSGYVLVGDKATPTLTTDEAGLTYVWTVDASGTKVTISKSTELTPTFTLLENGLYTFTLDVTDAFGNRTTIQIKINYDPYNPTISTPVPPVSPAQITQEIPPLPVPVKVQRAATATQNYQTAISPDNLSSTSATSGVAGTNSDDANADAALTAAAQSVQTSSQGWLILGVPWYWWLLGLAIIITAVQWYRSGAFRKPDDV